eukprot:TRINITY_DN29257_c0_g1_i1.p1 TRINITY_DN29257_c0_g1~~TRINITY_DN29257_c0_g1_i1.p1  ORF type:complete len:298 (-),score=52.52 TRINITY_DN29257_c0_g1_i1:20-913(-)
MSAILRLARSCGTSGILARLPRAGAAPARSCVAQATLQQRRPLLLAAEPVRQQAACSSGGLFRSTPFRRLCQPLGSLPAAQRRFASSGDGDMFVIEDAPRTNYLPMWQQEETTPPWHLKIGGAVLLAPLCFGAVAVHLAAKDDDGAGQSEDVLPHEVTTGDYTRVILSWSLHYAGALLCFVGAMHWGMQLANFGVPRKSDYMSLYYLTRFSVPPIMVLFGWLGSVLSVADSAEAIMWLVGGYVGLISCDFLAQAFYVAPPWWFLWRLAFSGTALACLGLLALSERNVYIGSKPMMRL